VRREEEECPSWVFDQGATKPGSGWLENPPGGGTFGGGLLYEVVYHPLNRMKIVIYYLLICSLLLMGLTGRVLAGPGAWDQTYAPTVTGGPVYAMALQPNGELLIGGAFTAVDGSFSRVRLARLFSDGTLDSTFFASGSGVSGNVWALAVETDGRIVIGGDFSAINGTPRNRIARLNSNGTVDGSFLPTNTINSTVYALAVQTNNAVVIGGIFGQGNFPSYNARLNADGSTDTSFSSYPNGMVYAVAVQADGRILIGGIFTSVNGANRYRIARLNSDGSLDNTFQNGMTGASSAVRCIQIQSDGKILIGGDFTTVNGVSRYYVARLNSDGSNDAGFTSLPVVNGSVYDIAVQPNNSLVIGGNFNSYNYPAGLTRVGRLYADGTHDTTFTNFGINNTVQSVAIQSDGGILIGGVFTSVNNTNATYNNTNAPYLARLYGDLYPPEFVVQPVSRNTNVGANVTFTAEVSNPTTTSFQWRLNGDDIPGATGTAYSLYNVQLSDAGNYSVFVTDANGGISSSNAVLQVGIAPAFTSQAGSLTVTQGQSASFSITAIGTPLNYDWEKNGVFITGQTNPTLTFASVVATNAAVYTCQVSNFLGSITSTGAVLTVDYPPIISAQPVGQTIGVGSNFTVNVTATGIPAVAYQWRINGAPIPGATDSNYTVTGAQTGNSGYYDVVITNSIGSITSSVAIVNAGYAPFVVQQPLALTNVVGGTAIFSCIVTGSAPINLQWTFNGNPLPGGTNANLTLTNLGSANIGYYALAATNLFGGTASSNASLNLNGFNFELWNGLVAYYPFNGNVSDVTGIGNNGTNYGAVLTSDRFGSPGSAYSFNGSSAYLDFGTPSDLAFSNNFTLAAWCSFSGGTQNPRIISFGSTNGYELLTDGTGSSRSFHLYCGSLGFSTLVNYSENTWYSVVAVVQNGTGYIYVDGNLAGSGPVSALGYTANLQMGTKSQNGSDFFGGSIDDVRFYNRALSANDVAYLYLQESQATALPPQSLSAQLGTGPNPNLNLNLTGLPGQSYVLQTATNLLPPIQWLSVLTNAADTNGIWQFTDTNLNSDRKFYRVTTP
jgi:uncharacterized delta-60 repeat protein